MCDSKETVHCRDNQGHLRMRQIIVEFVKSENTGEEEKASFLQYNGFTVADWVEKMSKPGIHGLQHTFRALASFCLGH